MKTIITTLTIILALTYGVSAQTDKQIADINKVVQEIKNNIGNYKQETKKWSDSSNNVRTIYRQDKIVKCSMHSYRDNNLDKKTNYYFSDGQLIFIEHIWTDENFKIVYQEKLYRADEHLIQWTMDDKKVDSNSKDYIEMDKQLIDISKSWKKDTK